MAGCARINRSVSPVIPAVARTAALVLIAFATCLTSPVVDAQRPASIGGAGTVQCGDFLAARKKESAAINSTFVSWLLGYISAYNQFSPNRQVRDIPSPATLLAFADRYCRDNPLSPFKHAADALLAELGGNLLTPGQVQ